MIGIGGEATRRVRLFRQRHTEIAKRIQKLCVDPAMLADINAWHAKKGIGRQRAEMRIKKRLPEMRWHKTFHPVLLGAYLNPSKVPLIATPGDPGQTQTSVMVNYWMLTEEEIHLAPWTLEVPDHALGRIAERNIQVPDGDLESVMFAAHQEALQIAMEHTPIEDEQSFLLKTPYGAFLSEVSIGHYPDRGSDEDRNLVIRPRTWLHEDQLFENQKPVQHGIPTLGATFLLPGPARRLRRREDGTLGILPNEYADRLEFFITGHGGLF